MISLINGLVPIRIRSGHNFTNIRMSNKPIYSITVSPQLLVALDLQSVDVHYKYLPDPAIITHDSDTTKIKKSKKLQGVAIPLAKWFDFRFLPVGIGYHIY